MKNLILMAAMASLFACTTTISGPEDDGSGAAPGSGGKERPPSGDPVACDIALDGDICAGDGESCSFSDGSIQCAKSCVDGRWSERCFSVTCETTACPSEVPTDGSTCNPNCVYECGYADVDAAECGVTEVIARCLGDGSWWNTPVCLDDDPNSDCNCEPPQ